VGIGECFLVNAASFVPITLALLAMRPSELQRSDEDVERSRGMVREGLRYVASKPVLRILMTMMAVIGTLEYNFQVILPVLAKETFGGDAGTFGLLGSVLGIGMFVGSMANATFGRAARDVLLVAGVALGLLTFLLALAPEVWVAALLMVPLGASSMAFLATMNSSLQLEASDAMRGRVMALYFVLFLGSTPVGAPLIGWIAEAIDPRAALGLGAAATLAGCLYGWFRLPAYSFDRAGVAAEIDPPRPRRTASWRA
jgi:predicted MFS family arabinose efflux permease